MTFAEKVIDEWRGRSVRLCRCHRQYVEPITGLLIDGGKDWLELQNTYGHRIVNAAHIESAVLEKEGGDVYLSSLRQ